MEKYVKLTDVINLIDKLAKEPAYQHVGEDWRNGVASVGSEVCELPAVELEEPKTPGKWIKLVKDIGNGRTLTKYQCSECGVYLAVEANYCPNCGVKMIKEGHNEP